MLNHVSKYKSSFKLFVEYIANKNINPNDFFTKFNTRIQYMIIQEWLERECYISICKYIDHALFYCYGYYIIGNSKLANVYNVVFDANNLELSYKVICAKAFEIVDEHNILKDNETNKSPF